MLRWKDGEFLNSSSIGAHYALGLRTKSGVWGSPGFWHQGTVSRAPGATFFPIWPPGTNLGPSPMAIILIAVVLAVITGANYFGRPVSRTMWLVLFILSLIALTLILATYLHF
jgi:hypothetical protein